MDHVTTKNYRTMHKYNCLLLENTVLSDIRTLSSCACIGKKYKVNMGCPESIGKLRFVPVSHFDTPSPIKFCPIIETKSDKT